MAEDNGDSEEEFRVDSGALENLVDVGAVAIELTGEPADGTLLALQLLLDELADMQGELLGIGLFVHGKHSFQCKDKYF